MKNRSFIAIAILAVLLALTACQPRYIIFPLPGDDIESSNAININYLGATESFVHEVTHAGQFETGDIAFDKQSGRSIGQDLYDEVEAYQAQYAYSPSSVMGIEGAGYVNSAQSITTEWVKGLKGGTLYNPNLPSRTGLAPLNINSGRTEIMKAYSKSAPIVPDNYIIRNDPMIYYKK